MVQDWMLGMSTGGIKAIWWKQGSLPLGLADGELEALGAIAPVTMGFPQWPTGVGGMTIQTSRDLAFLSPPSNNFYCVDFL